MHIYVQSMGKNYFPFRYVNPLIFDTKNPKAFLCLKLKLM